MPHTSLTSSSRATFRQVHVCLRSIASPAILPADARICALIGLAGTITACGAANPVRARAASDLSCPSDRITIAATGSRSYTASGCGASATYVCVEERPLAYGQSLLVQALASETVCIRESVNKAQPHIATVPFPSGVAGFTFGNTLTASKSICVDAGHWWQPREAATYRCGGTPTSVGYPAAVDVAFCSDQLCRIDVLIRAQDPHGWIVLHNDVRTKLEAHYGPSTDYTSSIPPTCSAALHPCLQNGTAQAATTWRWSTPHGVFLTIGRDGDGPLIRIRYETPALVAKPLL
jgi:hypothetical protein